MSKGGIFTLIQNNGFQDKLINATNILMKRLQEISAKKLCELRKLFPEKTDEELFKLDKSWSPTLQAIEKTHIMFVNSSFKPFVAMAHEYSKIFPNKGVPGFEKTFSFSICQYGDFVNDCTLYVKLTGLKGNTELDKVRYCDFPGHRLLERTSFKVSNAELDYYTSDTYNSYYIHKIPPNKLNGYLNNIGQEIPKVGYLVADPVTDEVREYRWFGNGPQTFKNIQPDLEMWIPTLFWFKDIQCSLPNFVMPLNQTDIEFTFCASNKLVSYANYADPGPPPANAGYTGPIISECYLYSNNIYMLPQIRKIFQTRLGFQLVRVHREHIETLTSYKGNVLLNALKWPVENIYIGFKPLTNLDNKQYWWRNSYITPVEVSEAVVTGVATVSVNQAVFVDEADIVQELGLSTQGITIYPDLSPSFYNNYLTYRYGATFNTPRFVGWYMMNFNINPGDYQPSGHLNVSLGRELYLKYMSAINPDPDPVGHTLPPAYYITPSTPCQLIVLADCINFLLVENQNAVLRFST
jgi:hypothetical protein